MQYINPLITPETIMQEVHMLLGQMEQQKAASNLFIVKKASQWLAEAHNTPTPRMLFGEFWHEGEICILFADTNLGKSILAVQIGDSISTGVPVSGFTLGAARQPVLYFDFELSAKQFENRYSVNYSDHYAFDPLFYRVELNPSVEMPDGVRFEDYLNTHLEQQIVETGIKVLIIDNLTYLRNETEKASDALPLMKLLKNLKSKYQLSILALAHTPKRDLSKPISRNDLQGSKMLMNFCDSAFTVGESSLDKHMRYLKQIKARFTEIVYDSENVCTCEINKPHNFLQFSFTGFGRESDHLKQQGEKDREELVSTVLELNRQGKSIRVIASELSVSRCKVHRILVQQPPIAASVSYLTELFLAGCSSAEPASASPGATNVSLIQD